MLVVSPASFLRRPALQQNGMVPQKVQKRGQPIQKVELWNEIKKKYECQKMQVTLVYQELMTVINAMFGLMGDIEWASQK